MWDPAHLKAANTLALGWDPTGPDLRLITADTGDQPASVKRLVLGGDYDVVAPDLDDRYAITIDTEPSATDDAEVSA